MAIVGTPSLQDPNTGKGQVEPAPFHLNDLLPELQELIVNLFRQLDYPTQCSLGMSCKRFVHFNPDFHPYYFANQCAALGYRTLLQYSFDCGGPFDKEPFEIAARHGHIGILQSYAEKKEMDPKLQLRWAECAAEGGQQHILVWLYENGLERKKVMTQIFTQIKLSQNDILGPVPRQVRTSCVEGLLPMLRFLAETGTTFHESHINIILGADRLLSDSRHFECLKYLHEQLSIDTCPFTQAIPLPKWATREAAQWMFEHGYRFDQNMLNDYLSQFAFPLGVNPNLSSLGLNHSVVDRDFIHLMLAQQAPITFSNLVTAAKTCNLAVLELLWQRSSTSGSPFTRNHFLFSLFDGSTMQQLNKCLENNHIRLTPLKKTVQWLLGKGLMWGPSLSPFKEFVEKIYCHNPKRKGLILSFAQDLKMPAEIIASLTSESTPPQQSQREEIDVA